jgi:hypothetical protein
MSVYYTMPANDNTNFDFTMKAAEKNTLKTAYEILEAVSQMFQIPKSELITLIPELQPISGVKMTNNMRCEFCPKWHSQDGCTVVTCIKV